MKYLILIYSNLASRKVWDALPSTRRAASLAGYAALTAHLVAAGEMLVSEAHAAARALDRRAARGTLNVAEQRYLESRAAR